MFNTDLKGFFTPAGAKCHVNSYFIIMQSRKGRGILFICYHFTSLWLFISLLSIFLSLKRRCVQGKRYLFSDRVCACFVPTSFLLGIDLTGVNYSWIFFENGKRIFWFTSFAVPSSYFFFVSYRKRKAVEFRGVYSLSDMANWVKYVMLSGRKVFRGRSHDSQSGTTRSRARDNAFGGKFSQETIYIVANWRTWKMTQ